MKTLETVNFASTEIKKGVLPVGHYNNPVFSKGKEFYKRVSIRTINRYEIEGSLNKVYNLFKELIIRSESLRDGNKIEDVYCEYKDFNRYGDEGHYLEILGYVKLTEQEIKFYFDKLEEKKEKNLSAKEEMFERLKKELNKE